MCFHIDDVVKLVIADDLSIAQYSSISSVFQIFKTCVPIFRFIVRQSTHYTWHAPFLINYIQYLKIV